MSSEVLYISGYETILYFYFKFILKCIYFKILWFSLSLMFRVSSGDLCENDVPRK